ncbi:hypothetical protein LTR85_007744 [Meristemomyces frigidus]|nr:hypothetical protein LTR85_007744 [Meristemomyces frigidus]
MTLGSFRRFQTDDYVMMVVLCFYTTLIATINIVRWTSSNLLPPGYDVANLSQKDIMEREYGSKLILVVEQCQIMAVWGAKACLLIMYLRLTTLRKENLAVRVLCGYVAFGFCFMEIFYFAVWCRPFYEYWQVPTSSVQCDAATNHLITNACFNLSSDLVMLAIGLPMFLRMQLPWKKKFPLICIFSLGIFVILAAILNKVYSFSEPFGSLWTYWYVRESSTALLVANLPFVWTFWRRVSGSATVNGVSRQNSASPEEVMSRSDRKNSRRTDSAPRTLSAPRKGSAPRSPADPWQIYEIEDDSGDEEVEMGEKKPKATGMTLNDMLRESNPDLAKEENPTPYTHPGLYFGSQNGSPQSPAQKAVVNDKEQEDLVRRDSSPEARHDGTPVSSVFLQSIASRKSAGSFL